MRVPRTAPRSGLARERVFRPDSAGREGRRRGSPPRARNAQSGSQRGFAAQIHRARNVARAAPVNCARMKAMTPAGAISGKGIGKCAGKSDGGIGEGRRGREPVGRCDVKADGVSDGARRNGDAAEDCHDEAERGDGFREPLARTGADMGRELPNRQFKHGVSNPDADDGPQDLGGQIDGGRLPRQFAAQGKCGAYRRIEMCTRHRSENQNEHCQDRAGGQRVAQKRQSLVTVRQPLGHDSRTDHGREQEGRAQCLGCRTLRGRRHQVGSLA